MRLFFIAALLILWVLASSSTSTHTSSSNGTDCTTCENKETCCDGEKCCGKGAMCCPTSSTCCQDTCCSDASQSCCPDTKHGGVCCEKEETFCCPPNPQFGLASRCCPRWYVCCDHGRYGCCNPTTGLPAEESDVNQLASTTNPKTAYLLFSDAGTFLAVTLDLSSSDATDVPVTGYNTQGESTRLFDYDPVRNVFYLPEANYLVSAPYPINLYTVDPVRGVATPTSLGLTGEVCGFKYVPSADLLYMATYDNVSTYTFFKVTPAGQATQYAQSQVEWAGWFDDISEDGLTTFRVGFESLTTESSTQGKTGLAVFDVTSDQMTWTDSSELPLPSGLGWYITLSNQNGTFYSMALDSSASLSLVTWSMKGPATATALNLNLPPYFGPPAQTLTKNGVAIAAVYDSWKTTFDRWTVGLVESNKLVQSVTPWPWYIITNSVSGLGIPYSA